MTDSGADLVILSGKLWSGRELDGQEAVAVGDGRILGTGTDHEVQRLCSPRTRVIDAGGRRVMPGLIDSHIHTVRAGTRWSEDVRWQGVASLSEALGLIAAAAADRDPRSWIAVLGGWNPHQFAESRSPSREDLDDAAPEHPVFVQRNYIECFLNTRALQEMGWMEGDAPKWVERDGSGRPGGRVSGGEALQRLRERLTVPDLETQVEGTRAMLRELNRLGLTGCIDAGGFGMTPDSYRPYLELWQRGERGFRARLLVGPSRPGREAAELDGWMQLAESGFGDEFLRYLGAGEVLLFAAHDMEGLDQRDVSGATAQLAELSRELVAHGWPVHIHAILDRSVGSILDAWTQVGKGSDLSDLRYTITHAEQVGEDNLARIRDMGLGVTIQNGMAFRGGDSLSAWGENRVTRAPPLRTMMDMGIPMGAGTDATVVSSYNPWLCVWWMVSGQTVDGSPPRVEDQRLSRDEALRLYTSGSAWFSFEEEVRGNLRAGSHADLVILSRDPLTVPEEEIPLIEADLTIVGGEVVHTADGEDATP